jgi:hypothetical protein
MPAAGNPAAVGEQVITRANNTADDGHGLGEEWRPVDRA